MRLLLKRNCLTARDLLRQELRASDKERKIIEAEGGKGQGGDTACLRSFLIKRSYSFLFKGRLLVQKSPGKKGRQRRYWRGVPSIVLIRPQHGKSSPKMWSSAGQAALSISLSSCRSPVLSPLFLPLSCQGHLGESPRAQKGPLNPSQTPERSG